LIHFYKRRMSVSNIKEELGDLDVTKNIKVEPGNVKLEPGSIKSEGTLEVKNEIDENAALIQPTTSANKRKLDTHSEAVSEEAKRRNQGKFCQFACTVHSCDFIGTALDIKRHTKEEHVQCYYCKYSGTPTGLKQHMKDVIVGVRHEVTCPIGDCKYSGTIIGLKQHKKAKHGTKKTPCPYTGCNFYGTPSGLKNHRKLKHKFLKCPLDNCKFIGTSLLALKDHTRAKHRPLNVCPLLWLCSQEDCNFTAISEQGDKEHSKLHGIMESGLLQIAKIQEDIHKAAKKLAAYQC